MNLAIQLLQCKPDNFVSQKLDNVSKTYQMKTYILYNVLVCLIDILSLQLPVDTQARVSQYVMSKTTKASSSAPSKNGNETDTFDASEYEFNISASLMTKILEDSIQDSVTKHCDTCSCSKSQTKPFCYNESYYSVATQTNLTGEISNSVCLTCNSEIKSIHSHLSEKSSSPQGIKLINDKKIGLTGPLYIIPQPSDDAQNDQGEASEKTKNNYVNENINKFADENKVDINVHNNAVPKAMEDFRHHRKPNSINMEPAVHHKLCDRTKTSISSKRSSSHSIGHDDLLSKDNLTPVIEVKPKSEIQGDNTSLRKNSHSSVGALSRTSSVAKSTVSTHKSNTQVGPGPRFCHLRMQAGSKNILLDNAEPNVPPVLYRRQSKCNENAIFKDLNEGLDNFIDLQKPEDDTKEDVKNDNVVVESTLIDVHIDSSIKEPSTVAKSTTINPILLNVSSSPLQPLKTHNFSNGSENNNNKSLSIGSPQNTSEVDNILLSDFTTEVNAQNNNQDNKNVKKLDVMTPTDEHDVKIFNFDRYEQNKVTSHLPRSLRKIDMSQLHSIENTKISKDFSPQGGFTKIDKKVDPSKSVLPAIVNVYPNLTQTHLKANEHKILFTNEQSTSSLSSDDSAAILQKQQLLRVAEWVEQNLEQQNNFNDPLEDEVSFNTRMARRDSKLNRLTATLNELALNMPHPVSKYAKPYITDVHNSWVNNNTNTAQSAKPDRLATQSVPVVHSKPVTNVTKETIFPVDCDDVAVTETNDIATRSDIPNLESKKIRETFKANGEITPEDLARMEYNVKKFLLSGPYWATPESAGRSRRTSSKTETDV